MFTKLLILIYRKIFCRASFYNFNLRVFDVCLRGIGILNYEGYEVSGESWFLHSFLEKRNLKVIIDVGANTDPYGKQLPNVQVFALEPNLATYKTLCKKTKNFPHIACFPIGLSDKKGKATLYDVSKKGTGLATLHKGNLEKTYGVQTTKSKIVLSTLDAFTKDNSILEVDLLKIDTEGNEYKVLQGASKMLAAAKIKVILFEFNEMNAYNGIFLKDFHSLLKSYSLYRLLPDGLAPLTPYRPITQELFAFQNIVAIHKKYV